jgi:endoribonuclease Dicer
MLLDSRISTTSNLTLLRQVVSRPREQVWKYRRLGPTFKTALYECLESRFGDMDCLSKTFTFSFIATSELGEWCSNRVWAYALAEAMLPKLHGRITSSFRRLATKDTTTKIEADTKRLEQAHEIVVNYKSQNANILSQVSSKVLLLYEMLSKQFEDQPDTKCIVFTRQRHTARLLGDLFTVLKVPNLSTGVLIGVRSGDDAGMNNTYHQQFKVLMSFRRGGLNCLVCLWPLQVRCKC